MPSPSTQRFEARDVPLWGEPIEPSALVDGGIFFFVHYADDALLVPSLQPVVFIGRNLEPGDSGRVYFQDAFSYTAGQRYADPSDIPGSIYVGSELELGHVFAYGQALNLLLLCSLRRRGIRPPR